MLFIGSTPLSGIGQYILKYTQLFPDHKYIQFNEEVPEGEDVFVFPLPYGNIYDKLREIKHKSRSVICMTICATETVHADYGKIFEIFPDIAVSSEFCRRVFARQFPDTNFHIIRAYIPYKFTPRPEWSMKSGVYRFYHIGNVLDQRKNTNEIIRAFIELNLPDAMLILKATALRPVDIQHPRIKVINGLLPQDKLDAIHDMCDCYVSFSSSEGIGLGAVEAAIRDKPVILPEYGGAPDYIKSDYMISCGTQEVPCDDFLFKKGMIWGKPDFEQLKSFMKDVCEKKIRQVDHSFTRQRVSAEEVLEQFKAFPR